MLRVFSKQKDDDRSKRMEALKNNDVERAKRRPFVNFAKTEEYLHKLGSKITVTKSQQEVEEAASVTAAVARAQAFPFSLYILYL
ncbi:hypothetical protein AgCh_012889 [Apium graveolens]